MRTEEVIDALSRQLDCYRRLSKLAQLQHQHVQQSQTEALLEVLTSRQQVLADIARLEAIVGPSKGDWVAFVGGLSVKRRQESESMLLEVKHLLEEITASDRNDVLALQQHKLNVSKQINQASAARKMNRQYVAAAYGPAKSSMDVQT